MERVIGDFVNILRQAGVAVSPAEHMDALLAAATAGLADRAVFKAALAACLTKARETRRVFERCFEGFFTAHPLLHQNRRRMPGGETVPEDVSPLAAMLLSQDDARLAVAMAEAVRAVRFEGAQSMLQRGLFVQAILRRLDVDRLNQDVDLLRNAGGASAKSRFLEEARDVLLDRVRSYVEGRLRLQAAATPLKVSGELLGKRVLLSRAEWADVEAMHRVLAAVIRRIRARHGRRRRRDRVGHLDFKGSLRQSIRTQGLIFDPRWKRAHPDRPDIVALCDVSRSVRHVTRFFLFFLHNLHALVSKIRTFVFCSNLVEVTDIFCREPLERALARIESGRGLPLTMGLTDYGKTFEEFASRHLPSISRRTVLVVLGDARNNHDDPAERAFRRIGDRVRRIVWLNPEPEPLWDTGDSVMSVYRPLCHVLMPCLSLDHLERLVDMIATLSYPRRPDRTSLRPITRARRHP